MCESDSVLRVYLAEDGVTYDDSTLAAALERLETATVPGSNSRLIRGEELRRLTGGSRHTTGARLPARAMVVGEVCPWNPVEYERADIEPYLLPASVSEVST
jgi:hypothetical protein